MRCANRSGSAYCCPWSRVTNSCTHHTWGTRGAGELVRAGPGIVAVDVTTASGRSAGRSASRGGRCRAGDGGELPHGPADGGGAADPSGATSHCGVGIGRPGRTPARLELGRLPAALGTVTIGSTPPVTPQRGTRGRSQLRSATPVRGRCCVRRRSPSRHRAAAGPVQAAPRRDSMPLRAWREWARLDRLCYETRSHAVEPLRSRVGDLSTCYFGPRRRHGSGAWSRTASRCTCHGERPPKPYSRQLLSSR